MKIHYRNEEGTYSLGDTFRTTEGDIVTLMLVGLNKMQLINVSEYKSYGERLHIFNKRSIPKETFESNFTEPLQQLIGNKGEKIGVGSKLIIRGEEVLIVGLDDNKLILINSESCNRQNGLIVQVTDRLHLSMKEVKGLCGGSVGGYLLYTNRCNNLPLIS